MREKTRERMSENIIGCMSYLKKKHLPFNQMKQYFASFITKLLKYKICSNSAASVTNWKFCMFCRFYIRPSPWKCLLSLQIVDN